MNPILAKKKSCYVEDSSESAENSVRKVLLQFYVDVSNDPDRADKKKLNISIPDVKCDDTVVEKTDSKLALKPCIEAVKVSCKQVFSLKTQVSALEKMNIQLQEKLSKVIHSIIIS